ncbi:MAG: condensation domain-containing protein, partial [Bacteroidota bacterium]
MKIAKFLDNIDQMNLSLVEQDGQLVLKGNKERLDAREIKLIRENKEMIDFIKENKQEIITHLQTKTTVKETINDTRAANISALYPLSPLQEGMLFHSLYQDVAGAYINQMVCDFWDLDIAAFQKSWDYLLTQHTILRSSFFFETLSMPLQGVHQKVSVPIHVEDLQLLSVEEQASRIKQFKQKDQLAGFDLKVAPLMRIHLFQLGKKHYRMIWTHHHILIDGWSTPIIIGKLLRAYEKLVKGEKLPEEREDRFEDYIRYIENKDRHAQLAFWKSYLADLDGPTTLPFIQASSSKGQASDSRRILVRLSSTLQSHIATIAQQYHLTTSTIMQGAWAYLLSRYTGKNSVVFGVTVSGRPFELVAADERVGLYINSIPLHGQLKANPTIASWLQELQKAHSQSREYQHTPLIDIQQQQGVKQALFDSLMVFENYPSGDEMLQGLSIKAQMLDEEQRTNYPLTITIMPGEELLMEYTYNASLLSPKAIEIIKEDFLQVLSEISQKIDQPLSSIDVLTENTQQQLLDQGQGPIQASVLEETLLSSFTHTVATHSNAIALVEGEQ